MLPGFSILLHNIAIQAKAGELLSYNKPFAASAKYSCKHLSHCLRK